MGSLILTQDVLRQRVEQLVKDVPVPAGPGVANWCRGDVPIVHLLLGLSSGKPMAAGIR